MYKKSYKLYKTIQINLSFLNKYDYFWANKYGQFWNMGIYSILIIMNIFCS